MREGQWGASEIIPRLYVGDLQDAQKFDGMIISVLPDWLEGEPAHAVWMPFLKNGWATLESTAALIDHALRLDLRVLVHCEEGCERAPLVVAWFLKTKRGKTLDEAYAMLKNARPIVVDRRRWLGIHNR